MMTFFQPIGIPRTLLRLSAFQHAPRKPRLKSSNTSPVKPSGAARADVETAVRRAVQAERRRLLAEHHTKEID